MIASPDRCDAPPADPEPRADAPRARSGGPRTPEGKLRSRRNALKHGLRAAVVLPDDLAAAVAEYTARFTEEFAPGSAYEGRLVAEMARAAAPAR